MSFRYGGDFNDYDATDNSFNCNGIVAPDRMWHPHAREVQRQYQSVWTEPVALEQGRVGVYNENFFRSLENCELEWQVVADGRTVRQGRVSDLDVAPQQRREYALGFSAADFPAGAGEVLVNVAYRLKNSEPLLDAGFAVARQQFVVRGYDFGAHFGSDTVSEGTVRVSRWERGTRVEGDRWTAFFSRDGFLSRYCTDGRELLAEGASLRPQFWRAPTENDLGAALDRRQGVWKNPEMKLESFEAQQAEAGAVVTARYSLPGTGASLTLVYRIDGAGAMTVEERMEAGAEEAPHLFRFGMTMEMPARYDRIRYYGRGAHENYADRLSSADLGLYAQRVSDQYHDEYVRPQESGTKCDVRWWQVLDSSGSGLEIVSDAPFSASALPYSTAALDAAALRTASAGRPDACELRTAPVGTGLRRFVGPPARGAVQASLRGLYVPVPAEAGGEIGRCGAAGRFPRPAACRGTALSSSVCLLRPPGRRAGGSFRLAGRRAFFDFRKLCKCN